MFACHNMTFAGDFTPVLAKHTNNLSLVDILAVGVDCMLCNFEPMQKQVEAWKAILRAPFMGSLRRSGARERRQEPNRSTGGLQRTVSAQKTSSPDRILSSSDSCSDSAADCDLSVSVRLFDHTPYDSLAYLVLEICCISMSQVRKTLQRLFVHMDSPGSLSVLRSASGIESNSSPR